MFGGRWMVQLPKFSDFDTRWLETLFILIGGHSDPHNDIVNGAVFNARRARNSRISVWLKVGNVLFYLSVSFVLTIIHSEIVNVKILNVHTFIMINLK